MIPRWPISPEVAKAIMEEQERRRSHPEEYPPWRYPFGLRAHLIAALILVSLGALAWLIIA